MYALLRTAIVLLFMLVTGSASAQGEFVEGRHYEKLAAQQPAGETNGIEVLEFFWYGCPHCFNLEAPIEAWLAVAGDDVVFKRVPAVLSSSRLPHARAYYVAESRDMLDRVHRPLFDALHVENRPVNNDNDLTQFFAALGMSTSEFRRLYNSTEVAARIEEARALHFRYGIESVPRIVVNGRYITSPGMADGYGETMAVTAMLVDMERARLAGD